MENKSTYRTIKFIALGALASALTTGSAMAAPSCCASQEPASLQSQLDARKAKSTANATDAMKRAAEARLQSVRDSGVLESAKRVGDQAPNFTLPHADGSQVELAALLEDGPVVLTWYRGGWCPYCNMQLAAMQDLLPAFEQANTTLVAISPEAPDHSLSTQEKNELDFYVLSDLHNKVGKDYGIVYELDTPTHDKYEEIFGLSKINQDESGELPLAVTYVVDKNGKIAYEFVDVDYTKRAEPAEILEVVQQLAQSSNES
ncbi:MAG: peroxiredoxin-like family protein [Puniceicoccales bacterium]